MVNRMYSMFFILLYGVTAPILQAEDGDSMEEDSFISLFTYRLRTLKLTQLRSYNYYNLRMEMARFAASSN